jgi:methionyl-tRNA synthetase
MPKATASLWEQLGADVALGPIGEQVVTDAGRWGQLPVGTIVTKGANLFPRLEDPAS